MKLVEDEGLRLSREDQRKVMAALGCILVTLLPHTTQEALAQKCADVSGIDRDIIDVCLADCYKAFFDTLTKANQ